MSFFTKNWRLKVMALLLSLLLWLIFHDSVIPQAATTGRPPARTRR